MNLDGEDSDQDERQDERQQWSTGEVGPWPLENGSIGEKILYIPDVKNLFYSHSHIPAAGLYK